MSSKPTPTNVLRAYISKSFGNPDEKKEPVIVVGLEGHAPNLAAVNAAKAYSKEKGVTALVDDEIDRAEVVNLTDDVIVINAPMNSAIALLGEDQHVSVVSTKDMEAKRRLDKAKNAKHVILNMLGNTGERRQSFNWNKTLEKLREQYPNVVVIGSISYSSLHEKHGVMGQFGRTNHVLQQKWTAAEFQDFAGNAFPRSASLGLLKMLDQRPELFESPITGDNGLTGPMHTSPREWLTSFTKFETAAGEHKEDENSGALAVKIIQLAQERLGSQVVEEIRQLPFAQNEASARAKSRMDTSGFLKTLGFSDDPQATAAPRKGGTEYT